MEANIEFTSAAKTGAVLDEPLQELQPTSLQTNTPASTSVSEAEEPLLPVLEDSPQSQQDALDAFVKATLGDTLPEEVAAQEIAIGEEPAATESGEPGSEETASELNTSSGQQEPEEIPSDAEISGAIAIQEPIPPPDNWTAEEADLSEQDLTVDLEAEMQAAEQSQPATEASEQRGGPFLAPLGKTSFDELDAFLEQNSAQLDEAQIEVAGDEPVPAQAAPSEVAEAATPEAMVQKNEAVSEPEEQEEVVLDVAEFEPPADQAIAVPSREEPEAVVSADDMVDVVDVDAMDDDMAELIASDPSAPITDAPVLVAVSEPEPEPELTAAVPDQVPQPATEFAEVLTAPTDEILRDMVDIPSDTVENPATEVLETGADDANAAGLGALEFYGLPDGLADDGPAVALRNPIDETDEPLFALTGLLTTLQPRIIANDHPVEIHEAVALINSEENPSTPEAPAAVEEMALPEEQFPIPAVDAIDLAPIESAPPAPAMDPAPAVDEEMVGGMVERVVDRVMDRLKPFLVVMVEEILREIKPKK